MLISKRLRQRHPTPVLLPGKSHGQRSLVGCSPQGLEESDTTEWLQFRFSLSCTGEGNGNPLQCSCLENPRNGGAWWAAVYLVTQTRTRLKWHSSSSCCLVANSCPALCNPMNSSPQGFSGPGICQARIQEWVAISFSRRSSWPRDETHFSCIDKQILYHWVTWETHFIDYIPFIIIKA